MPRMENNWVKALARTSKEAKRRREEQLLQWCSLCRDWVTAQLLSEESDLGRAITKLARNGGNSYYIMMHELPSSEIKMSEHLRLRKLVKQLKYPGLKFKLDMIAGESCIEVSW